MSSLFTRIIIKDNVRRFFKKPIVNKKVVEKKVAEKNVSEKEVIEKKVAEKKIDWTTSKKERKFAYKRNWISK